MKSACMVVFFIASSISVLYGAPNMDTAMGLILTIAGTIGIVLTTGLLMFLDVKREFKDIK